MVMSRKRCKIEDRHLIGSDAIGLSVCVDLGLPSRSFSYRKPFQVQFFVQLCSRWKVSNWHSASRGPSALDELVITNNQWVCFRSAVCLSKADDVTSSSHDKRTVWLLTKTHRWCRPGVVIQPGPTQEMYRSLITPPPKKKNKIPKWDLTTDAEYVANLVNANIYFGCKRTTVQFITLVCCTCVTTF